MTTSEITSETDIDLESGRRSTVETGGFGRVGGFDVVVEVWDGEGGEIGRRTTAGGFGRGCGG